MARWFFIALSLPLLTVYTAAADESAAAPVCINGASPDNNQLLKSIETNKDPLRLAYLAAKKSQDPIRSEAKSPQNSYFSNFQGYLHKCLNSDTSKKQFWFLTQVASFFDDKTSSPNEAQAPEPASGLHEVAQAATTKPHPALIKKECVMAAMKRAPGNDGYVCTPKNVPQKYGQAGGKTLQCVTEETADYMTFAVNKAIQCLSPPQPIDSRVIYKKFNNESAFNFSIAWRGGVGGPQLTSMGAGEVGNPTTGNGHHLLEEVAGSANPDCEPFKNIAEKDLNKNPLPIRSEKYCDWVNPGNGLARTLIYGIGLYLTHRDHYIEPAIEKRAPALLRDPGVISDLTSIAYGREGLDHARWLLQKFRVGTTTSPKALRAQLLKNSAYLAEIHDKTREAACIARDIDPQSPACKALNLTQSQMDGDECVSK